MLFLSHCANIVIAYPATMSISNGDLKHECQDILSKYTDVLSSSFSSLRSSRCFLDSSEFDIVYEALQRHPKATTKIGCGVQAIFVQADRFGSYCFHVQRTDGSEEDFSYRKIKMSPSETRLRYGYTWDGNTKKFGSRDGK